MTLHATSMVHWTSSGPPCSPRTPLLLPQAPAFAAPLTRCTMPPGVSAWPTASVSPLTHLRAICLHQAAQNCPTHPSTLTDPLPPSFSIYIYKKPVAITPYCRNAITTKQLVTRRCIDGSRRRGGSGVPPHVAGGGTADTGVPSPQRCCGSGVSRNFTCWTSSSFIIVL